MAKYVKLNFHQTKGPNQILWSSRAYVWFLMPTYFYSVLILFIHKCSILTYSYSGSWEGCWLAQCTLSRMQRNIFILVSNLKSPVHLTCIFLVVGAPEENQCKCFCLPSVVACEPFGVLQIMWITSSYQKMISSTCWKHSLGWRPLFNHSQQSNCSHFSLHFLFPSIFIVRILVLRVHVYLPLLLSQQTFILLFHWKWRTVISQRVMTLISPNKSEKHIHYYNVSLKKTLYPAQ